LPLTLQSGLKIDDPLGRLMEFCDKEYEYYDGITGSHPDRIEPIDVLATVAMNSFLQTADQIRNVHRAMAPRCDALLSQIPEDADMLTYDPCLAAFSALIHAAVQAPDVLVARAVKVLHRKRRNFIPMLDSVVLDFYLDASDRSELKTRLQNKARAASVAIEVMKLFRNDLRASLHDVEVLRSRLSEAGFSLTPVRILEILVWTQTEPRGYYRR
jgi:hypothetical protein